MAGTTGGRPSAISEHEIHLDAAETERWIAVAAEATGCRPDELSIDFACRPVFLVDDSLLLLLVYREDSPRENPAPADATAQPGPGEAAHVTLWCLAGNAGGDQRWIRRLASADDLDAAVHGTSAFRIDATTAADYVRTFADFARPAEGASVGAFPVLIERPGELGFWTPLNALEHDGLLKHLRENPLEAAGEVRYGFGVHGAALVRDELRRVAYTVCDRDVETIGRQGSRRGEIRVSLLDDKALMRGLPDNYLRALDARPTPVSGRQRFRPQRNGRVRLPPAEAEAVIRDINRGVLPLIGRDESTRVYRKTLPFYGLDLVEVSGAIHLGDRRNRFVVWKPGFAAALDTDTRRVHALNDYLAERRQWSLKTDRDAVEYLKFFCSFVWARRGPFPIVTQPDEIPRATADPVAVHVNPDSDRVREQPSPPSAEEIIGRISEPVVRDVAESGSWVIVATFFHAGTLALGTYRVDGDGAVEMLDDDQLLAWELPEGAEWGPEEPAEAVLPPIEQEGEGLREMAADDIVARVRAGQEAGGGATVEVLDRVICGAIDLQGERMASLRFVGCRFRGPVQLGQIACSGDIDIRDCVFEQGLGLAESVLEGRLSIDHVVVCGSPRLTSQETSSGGAGTALSLYESRMRNLHLLRVCLEGSLLAQRLRVSGHAEFDSMQTLQHLDLMSASVEYGLSVSSTDERIQACIHGVLDLEDVSARSIMLDGLRVCSTLYLRYAFAMQWIMIMRCRVGADVDLYGLVVERNYLCLANLDVAGDLEALFVRVGTGLWIEPDMDRSGRNRIGGTLDLGGAIIPQLLRIRRTDIGGDLSGRGVHAGELRLSGESRSVYASGDDRVTKRYPVVTIGGSIEFADGRFDGEAYIVGVAAAGALNLRHVSVGGDVTLAIRCADARERKLVGQDHTDDGYLLSEFGGGINLRKATVNGDLVLSSVRCDDALVDLADAEVIRDIEIRAVQGRARARTLRLAGLRCEGNMDISGLSLPAGCSRSDCRGYECERPACGQRREGGHVLGAGAKVAGRLCTATERDSAEIPGCLDLAFSEIGTLEISVDTFPLGRDGQCADGAAEACGVILRRANLGMLSLTVDRGDYPRPLDLGYTDIGWWQFNHRTAVGGNREEAAETGHPAHGGGSRHVRQTSDDPQDYIDLLAANEQHLQRHTWRSIENNLFNWGHETAADDVHRAMRRWLRDKMRREGPAPGFWNRLTWLPRRIGRRLFDLLTREVTEPVPAVLIMLVWTLVSTWLFSIPGNIGLSEPGYLTIPEEQRYETEHPDRDSWGLGAGFWTALHFHVPVALFTARDEWEPAGDRPLAVFGRDGRYVIPGVTPEDYANIVLIAHWFIWPVILVLYSRRYLRRAQQ